MDNQPSPGWEGEGVHVINPAGAAAPQGGRPGSGAIEALLVKKSLASFKTNGTYVVFACESSIVRTHMSARLC